MRLSLLIIILLNSVWISQTDPNPCCSNNMPIIPKKGCLNNGTSWIKETKCKAYTVNPEEQNIQITEEDTLILSETAIIPREKYCIGSLETENNTRILVCFPDSSRETSWSFLINIFCMIVTIISLILTIGIYLIIPKLRDLQGKCIMIMLFSLLIAFVFLISIQWPTSYSNGICYLIAISVYFLFLCTFFWMNVISFHIWRTIVNPSYPTNTKGVFKFYNIYGWGCPFILLIIAKIAYHVPGTHIKPSWTRTSCWFSDNKSLMLYFHIPVLIIMSINVLFFILSAWSLYRQSKDDINNKFRSKKYKFTLYLKLFLIMGICWIFEPLEGFLQYQFLSSVWIVTNIINALQGVIIFLILILFRKRVRRELARHKGFCCKKLPEDWATMANEDCEELSEETEKFTNPNNGSQSVT